MLCEVIVRITRHFHLYIVNDQNKTWRDQVFIVNYHNKTWRDQVYRHQVYRHGK